MNERVTFLIECGEGLRGPSGRHFFRIAFIKGLLRLLFSRFKVCLIVGFLVTKT